ncbi:MAG: 6-carboxytetrahydropterin synthase QueD [Elusimicrobia bacterium]|nr:6-carboxytetrahydropterin synthase QueD [Candidatus Liberimonas magnetica]
MKYCIVVEDDFSSAHALRGYKGKCENLHGHNWKVKVSVGGKKLGKLGMLMDFKDLKMYLSKILTKLDHLELNKLKPFDKINPTAENIASYIFNELENSIKKSGFKGIKTKQVMVWESDITCVVVSK